MGSSIYGRVQRPVKYGLGQAVGDALQGGGAYFGTLAIEKKKAQNLEAARQQKIAAAEAAREVKISDRDEKREYDAEVLNEKRVHAAGLLEAKGEASGGWIGSPQRIRKPDGTFALVGVTDDGKGGYEYMEVAVDGEFVNVTGETGDAKVANKILGAGGSEEAKLKAQTEFGGAATTVIEKAKADIALLSEIDKKAANINLSRYETLAEGAEVRDINIEKAEKFLKAFEENAKSSGSGQKLWESLPGVFTDQGEFNEELNAFSEVVARAALKSAGETRPTDADVAGMKKAVFGVGRDENVNITLLKEFIAVGKNENEQMHSLYESANGGSIHKLQMPTGSNLSDSYRLELPSFNGTAVTEERIQQLLDKSLQMDKPIFRTRNGVIQHILNRQSGG
jgi:hypothetical protein